VLKEYVARGTFIFPPQPAMRLVTDTFSYCVDCLPKWNFINVSGYHIREAGADAIQELAFTMANAVAYIRAALEVGIDIDRLAPSSLSSLYRTITSLRKSRSSARQAHVGQDHEGSLRARTLDHRFCVSHADSRKHSDRSAAGEQRRAGRDPGPGGSSRRTQSLHTCARDEALALPTEESAQLALRTQQIIAYESGVADTVDPLAGSYYVEWLTDELGGERGTSSRRWRASAVPWPR